MKIINFSETLALWGHLKTLNIFKNCWTFLEPISEGTCRLLGHIKIPIFIFLHRRSMHPSKYVLFFHSNGNTGEASGLQPSGIDSPMLPIFSSVSVSLPSPLFPLLSPPSLPLASGVGLRPT